jgi:hypothetical protein
MPTMTCTCSTVLDYGRSASPVSWFLFSEAEQVALPETAGMAKFAALMKHAVLCPTCSRLWIWWRKGEAPVEYVPATTGASDATNSAAP